MTILVANVRKPVPEGPTPIYIGRRSSYKPNMGEDFSVLGNPFPVPLYSREEAIAKYHDHLIEAMADVGPEAAAMGQLIRRVRVGEKLALLCWCKPLACHGDVVKAEVEYLLKADAFKS